jgi:hypothetical protein
MNTYPSLVRHLTDEAEYISLAAQFRRILPYLVVQPTKSPQKQH